MANIEKLPSNRRFGTLLGGLLIVLAIYHLLTGKSVPVGAIFACAGLLLLVLGLLAPEKLSPLNQAWFHLGLLLGRIFNPIVLGILYFGIITPVALILRLAGRDELRLRDEMRLQKDAGQTYWVDRKPPGPDPDSFRHQF